MLLRPDCLKLAGLVLCLAACARERGEPPRPASRWTIGIYAGPSPFRLESPAGVTNPVLTASHVTDMEADIVAHPFLVAENSRYYLFFTVKNSKAKEGGIGLAESADGLRWTYRKIVLDEPFDLAYPMVFKWGADYYMVPEAHTESVLRLYRATAFPERWAREADLLTGDRFISASVVHHRDTWWMFVARPGNATLRLFIAGDLRGPWTEHPRSPVVEKDPNIARPAGRPLVVDGTLYRLAQDCHPTYGNQVLAFRVTEITRAAYREEMLPAPLVKATSQGWNAEAMHHVDLHPLGGNRWLAAVDALGK